MSERGLEKTITSGIWLDRRGCEGDRTRRSVVEDPADRLEHDRAEARPSAVRRIPHRSWTGCMPISCTPIISKQKAGEDVLAIADYGGPVTAAVAHENRRRHAVPSREEPGARAGADRQFPEVEAMTETARKGYWMAMVDVTDPDNYPKYIAANKAAFDKYGARFIVRGGRSEVFEGPAATRMVVIEFDITRRARLFPLAGISGGAEAAASLFQGTFRHRRGRVILFPAIDLKDGALCSPQARRYGPGDGLQRRPGRAGQGVRGPRV